VNDLCRASPLEIKALAGSLQNGYVELFYTVSCYPRHFVRDLVQVLFHFHLSLMCSVGVDKLPRENVQQVT
jgi:hypothetical protein